MKRNLNHFFSFICIVLGLFLAGMLIFYFHTLFYVNDTDRKNDVLALENEMYDCLYVSMYSEQETNPYPFEYNLGLKTYTAKHCYDNLRDYTDYINTVLSGESDLSEIYTLFEPALVNKTFFGNDTLTQKAYHSTLKEIISAYEHVNFKFMLPAYSVNCWEKMTGHEQTKVVDSILLFCNEFRDFENVKIFYFGNREWLVENLTNYEGDEYYTEEVLTRLVTLTLITEEYLVDGINLPEWLEETSELVEKQKFRTEYDLSEYEIVFLGDSIVGNYTGSLSIPGVVNYLSGAETYNCSLGGQSASEASDGENIGFGRSVSFFLGEDEEHFTENEHFYEEITRFHNADHSNKKLCIVINYGINDYYSGRPVIGSDENDIYSYQGALRNGIQRLKQEYPKAEIVLMTPNFVWEFDFGIEINGAEGDVLTAYVDAGVLLAEELGIHCINNYLELGINEDNCEEYIADGTHLNENGRYKYSHVLIEYLIKIS